MPETIKYLPTAPPSTTLVEVSDKADVYTLYINSFSSIPFALEYSLNDVKWVKHYEGQTEYVEKLLLREGDVLCAIASIEDVSVRMG